jgi:hypothetical protein
VYRHDHGHPSALDVFLACTLPLAEKAARRRAHKVFIYPSDWQLELMYDGAVAAAIAVFQCNFAVETGTNAFRRYLLRALALGAVRSYFKREENDSIRAVADLAALPIHIKARNNQAEQDIIARDLLDQVTGLPTPVASAKQIEAKSRSKFVTDGNSEWIASSAATGSISFRGGTISVTRSRISSDWRCGGRRLKRPAIAFT